MKDLLIFALLSLLFSVIGMIATGHDAEMLCKKQGYFVSFGGYYIKCNEMKENK